MPRFNTPFVLAFATAILLSGCKTPSPVSNATAVAKMQSAAKTPAAAPAVTVISTADVESEDDAFAQMMLEEEALDALDEQSDEDGPRSYGLMAVASPDNAVAASPKPKFTKKVADRLAKLRERFNTAQNKQSALEQALRSAPWQDNGDGTKTHSVALLLEAPYSGQRTLSRTIRTADNVMTKRIATLDRRGPNGGHTVMRLEKTLQPDGTYLAKFTSETINNQKLIYRKTNWTKLIARDESVMGRGNIQWLMADGTVLKEVKILFAGPKGNVQVNVIGADAAANAEVQDALSSAAALEN